MSPIIFYDLEYTAWEGSHQRQWSEPWEHREIVQIGAVKVDTVNEFNEIDHLNVFVKPKINPQLSEYFIQLTQITQQQIDQFGVPFHEAWDMFLQFSGDSIPLISNGRDFCVFEENCTLHHLPFSIHKNRCFNANPFLSHYTETQKVVSSELPAIMGFTQNGTAHDGLDDARNVAYSTHHIIQSNHMNSQTFLNHPLLKNWGDNPTQTL